MSDPMELSLQPPAKRPRLEEKDLLVNPDDGAIIPDPRKPAFDPNDELKSKVLNLIIDVYDDLILEFTKSPNIIPEECAFNLTLSHQLTSVIHTAHNICRQRVLNANTNMMQKAATNEYKITYIGNEYLIKREVAETIWKNAVKKYDFVYNEDELKKRQSWIGIVGPYLSSFGAFGLRLAEIRVGHNNFPIRKVEGRHTSFPVSRYGISGAHHVLLEGSSYPPERKSAIAQSMGPLTSLLTMVRSEGKYREKWEMAVKRAMSHIPCIDDFIEVSKTTRQSSELAPVISLMADIMLISGARNANKVALPLSMMSFARQFYAQQNLKDKFIAAFNLSGHGGFLAYKTCTIASWSLEGNFKEDQAREMIFHGIFGTHKEDLSILAEITNFNSWSTREEIGKAFIKLETPRKPARVELIRYKIYSKLAKANQTGLLAGVYHQITPYFLFSGPSTVTYDVDFFEHIEKRQTTTHSAKTIPQMVTVLTKTLSELVEYVKKNNNVLHKGTGKWYDFNTLSIECDPAVIDTVVRGIGHYFMGRSNAQ